MTSNAKPEPYRFKLKIRPNSQGQFEVLATSDMLVSELKAIISTFCGVPANQQRLISSGKLLKDESVLSSYKLDEGHVVQLSTSPQAAPEAENPENLNQRERFRGIDQNERLETIKQSLQTTNLMLEVLSNKVEDDIIGFDNRLRKFYPGQWVDVLDTVEQWLEGQVKEVATTSQGTLIFIHYNGWPSQWDEWIDSSSPRIQPFHSYTNQSITAPMNSPHPTVPLDDENLRNSGPHDQRLFITQGLQVMNKMKGILEKYYNLNTINRHEKVAEKVNDLRCRLGIGQGEDNIELAWGNESVNEVNVDNEDKESISSVENERNEIEMSNDVEFGLVTVQAAPLLDRTGRLLSDLATLIPMPSIPLMPSPAELSHLTSSNRSDVGIHIYALVTPRRPN
ncbi:hypothetical protein SteCoe_18534 [Stentor coeruleus]|uniref:Ubiquitin-like domain-containing protein n=1 Tax=Stentor coeruleus TaxID=5963 RepID=A0A1R2BWV0_9CILI|nr:hypothetical protein SteCoe_18534 [Stentor coeruleus]